MGKRSHDLGMLKGGLYMLARIEALVPAENIPEIERIALGLINDADQRDLITPDEAEGLRYATGAKNAEKSLAKKREGR